jgi:hypothetical protein
METPGMSRRQLLAGSAAVLAHAALSKTARAQSKTEVSGDYYDWQKTMKPETPWLRNYSQIYQSGLFLCQRDGDGAVKKVYLTFEQALDAIRKIDNLTLGIPKIIFLVGWQFNGHDSGYPSWSVVNEHLKRPQDATALDSLRWLMVSAREYHTTVTLHINMFDAYRDSPLWKVYDENNIIIKDAHAEPIEGPRYDDMQSYQISYAQEWKLGYAQKRIDALLRMLPELKEAGTIHIDAFKSIQGVRPSDPISSPLLGYTIEDELAAQRKILRYWRMNGVDVSTEYAANTIDPDPFVGLQVGPNCLDIDKLLDIDWYHKPAKFLGFPPDLMAAAPCAQDGSKHDWHVLDYDQLLSRFCMQIVPWYYRNNPLPKEERFNFSPDYFSDVFILALWRPWTLLAYSTNGNYDFRKLPKTLVPKARTWRLPKSWHEVSSVKVSKITVDGQLPLSVTPVQNGTISLLLSKGEAVAIEKNS